MKKVFVFLILAQCFFAHCFADDISSVKFKVDKELKKNCVNLGRTAIYVLDVENGKGIYSLNENKVLKPASCIKLLTTSAALNSLGGNYNFETKLLGDGEINGEIYEGNWFIKAGGDPFLVNEQLYLFVQSIAMLGVKEITGDLILDLSSLDEEEDCPGWRTGSGQKWYEAPISPLSFNFNTITVYIQGKGKHGTKPCVIVQPETDYIQIDNQATISSSGKETIYCALSGEKENSKETLKVVGRIRTDNQRRFFRAINSPPEYFAKCFREMLQTRSIVIKGQTKRGSTPETAKALKTHSSPPLTTIIRGLNHHSNNLIAELILKKLGAEQFGEPGTTEKGIKAVKKFLSDLNISVKDLDMSDGSGLSHQTKMRTKTLVETLVKAYNMYEFAPEFVGSLSMAGSAGTLVKRLTKDKHDRRVRGKSGHLSDVCSMAGYLKTDSGRVLAFAMVFNDYQCSWSYIKAIEDKICEILIEAL